MATPEWQQQTAEVIARTWERRPWPAGDLFGYHVYAGYDGSTPASSGSRSPGTGATAAMSARPATPGSRGSS
ncbi:hypothetical protein AB0L99_17825 [Streptomyces sp. NPDC051954]|uniref:hypothetical protein n=1 Tax=Streptomyces sp. NPDC051954 TaxID=3155524 RepID=UPI003419DDA3